jgi:hypothetical protein
MTAPKFIEIEGKRHLWRDIIKLRQEQIVPPPKQHPCSRRCGADAKAGLVTLKKTALAEAAEKKLKRFALVARTPACSLAQRTGSGGNAGAGQCAASGKRAEVVRRALPSYRPRCGCGAR